jgi:hypothetical protein
MQAHRSCYSPYNMSYYLRKGAPLLPQGWDTKNQGVPIPMIEITGMPMVYLNLAALGYVGSTSSNTTRFMSVEIELR